MKDTLDQALHWVLLDFHWRLLERQADAPGPGAAYDCSDIYDDARATVRGLCEGHIDPEAYLEQAAEEAEET